MEWWMPNREKEYLFYYELNWKVGRARSLRASEIPYWNKLRWNTTQNHIQSQVIFKYQQPSITKMGSLHAERMAGFHHTFYFFLLSILLSYQMLKGKIVLYTWFFIFCTFGHAPRKQRENIVCILSFCESGNSRTESGNQSKTARMKYSLKLFLLICRLFSSMISINWLALCFILNFQLVWYL